MAGYEADTEDLNFVIEFRDVLMGYQPSTSDKD